EKRRAAELTDQQRQVLTRLARCPRVWESPPMLPVEEPTYSDYQRYVATRLAYRRHVATRRAWQPRTLDWGGTILDFHHFGLPEDQRGLAEFLELADGD